MPPFGTALKVATERNNIKIVQLLLDIGVEVDATDASMLTYEALTILRKREPYGDNELETYCLSTALTVAAKNEFCEIICLLLEYGAAINHRDSNRQTAFFAAAMAYKRNAVKLLLDKGADVNVLVGKREFTRLTSIFERLVIRDNEIILSMLNAVSDPNKNIPLYGNLLHMACANSAPAAVKLLIEKGADVNAKDSTGLLLFSAWFNGHWKKM